MREQENSLKPEYSSKLDRKTYFENVSPGMRWFIAVLGLLAGLFLLLLGLGVITFSNSRFPAGQNIVVFASLPFLIMGFYIIFINIFNLKYYWFSSMVMGLFYLSVLTPFHIIFFKTLFAVGWRIIYIHPVLCLIIALFDFVFGIALANFVYKIITGRQFLIEQNSPARTRFSGSLNQ